MAATPVRNIPSVETVALSLKMDMNTSLRSIVSRVDMLVFTLFLLLDEPVSHIFPDMD